MKKNNSIKLWLMAFIMISLHVFLGIVACVVLIVSIKIYANSAGTFHEKIYLLIEVLKYCLTEYFSIALSLSILLGAVGATKIVAES